MKNDAQTGPKSIKNDAWERQGAILETGPLQDPQKVNASDTFFDPFGATWPIWGATWAQPGAK